MGDHFLTGVEISPAAGKTESIGPSSLESVDDSLVQMMTTAPSLAMPSAISLGSSTDLIQQLKEQLKDVEEKCQELVREIKVRL